MLFQVVNVEGLELLVDELFWIKKVLVLASDVVFGVLASFPSCLSHGLHNVFPDAKHPHFSFNLLILSLV